MQAIDTHIHLDFISDFHQQMDEARLADIAGWVVPGVAPAGWKDIASLAERYAKIFAAPGVHPESAEHCTPETLKMLRRLLSQPKVVAVGEVGLDREVATGWQIQEEVFVQMIRLAKEVEKPLVIHTRKSIDRVLELLRREGAQQVGGIFHAFSGSLETAQKIIDMGFVLGVGGVVTWPSARRLPEVVSSVSAEALVVETDAPFMTPAPYQGQPNRAAYLAAIIEKIAELRSWNTEKVMRLTTENAQRVLTLREE